MEASELLLARGFDAVMLGRRAREDPFLFARADRLLASNQSAGSPAADGGSASSDRPPTERSRRQVLERYCEYAAIAQTANWGGGRSETLARDLLKPLGGLFYDTSCGPKWRQTLAAAVKERDTLRSVPVADVITRCIEACGLHESGLLDAPPAPGVAAQRRARERSSKRLASQSVLVPVSVLEVS